MSQPATPKVGTNAATPGPVQHVELRRAYYDSVTLLRISQAVAQTPGVSAAQVAMATELNVELIAALGFSIPETAGPNDLLVALQAADDAGLTAGMAAVDTALADATAAGRTSGGFGDAPAPLTVAAAADLASDAAVVLLSVPGGAVLGEAMDAIEAGRHVMIFSDNVPVEHEVALKDAAAAAGVLVMGPDCGTSVIGGVGLGFANVLAGNNSGAPVGATKVGVIAASGTGAQHLTCLLDEAGVGISQVIGVGGRDLSEPVGGRSTLAALALLDADPDTGHIVVISKPPHPDVAAKVQTATATCATPSTVVLLGAGQPTITEAAEAVLGAVGAAVPSWPHWGAERSPTSNAGAIRGLFSGGTLADEAMLVIGAATGDPVRSNIPLSPDLALPDSALAGGVPNLTGLGTVVVDLGDDAFTRGRPHPMIDPTVKLDLLAQQASDPQVRVILLDVVLGHCAEPDPAARLAPAISQALAAATGRDLDVVVSLCATAADPQDRQRQADALVAAGAVVRSSNAAAATLAAKLAAGTEKDI